MALLCKISKPHKVSCWNLAFSSLISIFTPMKFHVDILHSFWDRVLKSLWQTDRLRDNAISVCPHLWMQIFMVLTCRCSRKTFGSFLRQNFFHSPLFPWNTSHLHINMSYTLWTRGKHAQINYGNTFIYNHVNLFPFR